MRVMRMASATETRRTGLISVEPPVCPAASSGSNRAKPVTPKPYAAPETPKSDEGTAVANVVARQKYRNQPRALTQISPNCTGSLSYWYQLVRKSGVRTTEVIWGRPAG